MWEVIWFGTRERKQNKGYGASLFRIAQKVAAQSGVNGILVTATNEVVVWWMTCTAGKGKDDAHARSSLWHHMQHIANHFHASFLLRRWSCEGCPRDHSWRWKHWEDHSRDAQAVWKEVKETAERLLCGEISARFRGQVLPHKRRQYVQRDPISVRCPAHDPYLVETRS